MKRIITISTLLMFIAAAQAFAAVKLKINHYLGEVPISLALAGENNLGERFKLDRLEYYISQISITHDGGKVTTVENYWILVNTAFETDEILGDFDIQNVESITFYVGVEQAVNHLDPSQYDSGHPLAPKFPSMHWGWQSGYRFVALEGHTGESLNTKFEIHALGNQNYFNTTVNTGSYQSGDDIIIEINADYAQSLRDIELSSGPIIHGDVYEAVDLLENFAEHVYSPVVESGVETANSGNNDYAVGPNPSNDGVFSLVAMGANNPGTKSILVADILGNEILELENVDLSSGIDLKIDSRGVFILNIIDETGFVHTEKLIVR